jgi:tetratricopeptide (TPR) repeat protein
MTSKDSDDWNIGDIEIPDGQNEGLKFILNLHLAKGRMLMAKGLFREAIEEFKKEFERPIQTYEDADIVQHSYWFSGRAYRQLGEIEQAIDTLEKSRELLKLYGLGPSPHEDLAEIYISMGLFDDAIEICEECLEKVPAWPIKQLLNKALELRKKQEQEGGDN